MPQLTSNSIPNLPFFYLVYRAWSHWRAWSGSKHIEFLLDKNLLKGVPSTLLDDIYTASIKDAKADNSIIKTEGIAASPSGDESKSSPAESMVLQKWNGKMIAEALAIPELEMEIERAVWQVSTDLKAQNAQREEKLALERATKAEAEGAKTKKE